MPQPFDFELTLGRFRANGVDLLNTFGDDGYARVIEGQEVRVNAVDGGVQVSPTNESLEARVRRLFGAADDLEGFGVAVESWGDETLKHLLGALRGLRIALIPDPLEMLVTSITAQQISQAAALAVRNRVVERLGTRCGAVHDFPSAEALTQAGDGELRALGLSRPKAQAVLAIAGSDVEWSALESQPDDAVIDALVELRGIGRWSAEWYLVRHLGRPDVWPAGDLALRRAVAFYYPAGNADDEDSVRGFGERFAPYRSLVCHYLLTGVRLAET